MFFFFSFVQSVVLMELALAILSMGHPMGTYCILFNTRTYLMRILCAITIMSITAVVFHEKIVLLFSVEHRLHATESSVLHNERRYVCTERSSFITACQLFGCVSDAFLLTDGTRLFYFFFSRSDGHALGCSLTRDPTVDGKRTADNSTKRSTVRRAARPRPSYKCKVQTAVYLMPFLCTYDVYIVVTCIYVYIYILFVFICECRNRFVRVRF